MPIFHQTLNDAIDSLKKGNIKKALEILETHEKAELQEETYVESSLYEVKLYLKNYVSHLYAAIKLLAEDPNEDNKTKAIENIVICKKNIDAFEIATKGLLEREGNILK